ncbi:MULTISPECIES: antibiotic biosynthesis monooxygenase [unclassified Halomonas]|uniref:putative quinol monooxygenase n=1 Tax=unclassified Halomonas TaxID=2609666 RepID=UPI0020A11E87|nr:antibiotic biosynthesis monooxygenase [Halomonas sp. 707D7]MCP1327061.1 antibiotic biosynthesis monooxygenase [Halomonas sp. 707D4]
MLHKQLTLQEPGCITFRVEQDEHDPCRFRVQETFVDRAAFDHHQQRTASSHWGRLTRNARREYEVTE